MNPKLYNIVVCIFSRSIIESVTYIDDDYEVQMVDLTRPTVWKDLMNYYNAVENQWKVCINCGSPGLGTAMHLEYLSSEGSMHPAAIPVEYLMTRLVIIDVTSYTYLEPNFVLTLKVAQSWPIMKHDPREPTLILFKFGWNDETNTDRIRSCICNIPGIAYDLAEWIAVNMSHVVGVATDAPSLESEQTREHSSRTVANLLGKSGVYMIENVHIRNKISEHRCMAIAMPLKLPDQHYIPTRLIAFCPTVRPHMNVVITVSGQEAKKPTNVSNRIYDVDMDEIMSLNELK